MGKSLIMFMKEGNIHIQAAGTGTGDTGVMDRAFHFSYYYPYVPHITLPSFSSDPLGGFFSVSERGCRGVHHGGMDLHSKRMGRLFLSLCCGFLGFGYTIRANTKAKEPRSWLRLAVHLARGWSGVGGGGDVLLLYDVGIY